MKKHLVLIAVVVVLFSLMTSCAQKQEKKGPHLAKVGTVKITQADLERDMKHLPEFAQKLFEGPSGKERFLDEMIKKELLYQEALKRGLDKNPEFAQKLEEFKKLTLISILLEKEIEEKTRVTEQDVKDYYDQHKDELAAVTQIRASHILVRTEGEAKKILEKLKKGEDFASLAKHNSIDPATAANGGDLGYFSPGQMVPEFEAAAQRLGKNEFSSEPVKTKFGYHIIKVTDKKRGQPVEFEKIKGPLFQRISAERQKQFFDSYIEELKKKYKVEVNKEAVAALSADESKREGVEDKPEAASTPESGITNKK